MPHEYFFLQNMTKHYALKRCYIVFSLNRNGNHKQTRQSGKSQIEECTGGIHRKYNIKYLSFSVRVRH